MTLHRVAVVGAGAAGLAAAATLSHEANQSGLEIEVRSFIRTREVPHNRTLVNKGVVLGLIEPDQASLTAPALGCDPATVRGVEPRTRRVYLDSGRSEMFDALIIASGSRPRALGEEIVGRDQAVAAGRLGTLHSLSDAVRVREQLASGPARVLMLGGGILSLETASLLTDHGHDVVVISRKPVLEETGLNDAVASHLSAQPGPVPRLHQGRRLQSIRTHRGGITLLLDDGTQVDGDLAIVAHGTTPSAPAPWSGPGGVAVDSRLRVLAAPDQRIFAAGGVAVHHYPRHASYRVDHWEDSAAQGRHAARALLFDLGSGADPGTYLPASGFSALVQGRSLMGVGHPRLASHRHVIAAEPLLVGHYLDDILVAMTGINAAAPMREWAPHLHVPTTT